MLNGFLFSNGYYFYHKYLEHQNDIHCTAEGNDFHLHEKEYEVCIVCEFTFHLYNSKIQSVDLKNVTPYILILKSSISAIYFISEKYFNLHFRGPPTLLIH